MRKFTSLMLGVLMTLGMYAQDEVQETKIYVIGSACEAGWNLPGAEMTFEGEGIYTYTGELQAKGDPTVDEGAAGFRFTVGGSDWWPGISPVGGYTVCEDGVEYKIGLYNSQPEEDPRFQVAEAGTYTICINMDYMRMTCVKGSEPLYPTEAPVMSKDALFLVGGALNENGEWDHSREPLAIDPLEAGAPIFMTEVDLYAKTDGSASEFKFKTIADSWDGTIVSAVENQVIEPLEQEETPAAEGEEETPAVVKGEYAMVYRPFESSPNDWTFKVAASGTYALTIDLDAMVLLVEGFTPFAPESGISPVAKDVVDVLAAANTITLSAKGDHVIESAVLYDVAGKCISRVAEAGARVVLGEGLNRGLYIVKMTCGGEDYVQKVMLK